MKGTKNNILAHRIITTSEQQNPEQSLAASIIQLQIRSHIPDYSLYMGFTTSCN